LPERQGQTRAQAKLATAPSPDQPGLRKALAKLADVDITPFALADPNDPDTGESPYAGYFTIEELLGVMSDFLKVYKDYERLEARQEIEDPVTHEKRMVTHIQHELGNPIEALRIAPNMTVGYVLSRYRRGQLDLLRKYTANWEFVPLQGEPPFDGMDRNPMNNDIEGKVETIVRFDDGWRWFDLHRPCSNFHGHQTMGHCGNTVNKREGQTIYELDQPLTIGGKQFYRPHATFIFDREDGSMGEMKGRKNQKPTARLWKYIIQLLENRTEIVNLTGQGYVGHQNFMIKDLTPYYQDRLWQVRPDLWELSNPETLPGGTNDFEAYRATREQAGQGQGGQGPAIQGHVGPGEAA
jgi:hypothetical protein